MIILFFSSLGKSFPGGEKNPVGYISKQVPADGSKGFNILEYSRNVVNIFWDILLFLEWLKGMLK